MEQQNIMVSVIVTTYNQESYIQQALEGILNQKVSFTYDILVGDDCSTDKTGDKIKQIQAKSPVEIKVYRNRKNIGEKKTTCKLLRHCRGKYIAVCEGDDYWTNDTKLERQVRFLEENKRYIGTAHNVLCVNEKGNKLSERKSDFPHRKQYIYGKENALRYEEIGQMSSYVYRNIWKDTTEYDFQLFEQCNANTDVKLNATLGMMGEVYFFEETWSCRRRIFRGAGWTAYAVNNNIRDYSFASCINVKKYVKERFQGDMEVDDFLFDMQYDAITEFIHSPTRRNFRVIRNIYCQKGESCLRIFNDVMRIWIFQRIWKDRAREYERIVQKIKRFGYYSPTIYWIADEGNCIYVQNPKVACSSIKAAMYHLPESIKDYEVVHNVLLKKGQKLEKRQNLEKDFPDAFKFSYVRNPYERVVSCYVNKFITDKKNNKENYFKDYFIRSIQEIKKFSEFVMWISVIPDKLADWHFRSQHCFMCNGNGRSYVDYIGKYENMQVEFSRIAEKYHFNQMKWYNKSFDYDWRDYYTLGTALLVYIRYHRDFKMYGYQHELKQLLKYIVMKKLNKRRKMRK